MCGIVGIFLKNKELHSQLGSLFSPMLTEMGDRGPDSSGFAIYRDKIEDEFKVTLHSASKNLNWKEVEKLINSKLKLSVKISKISSHAIFKKNLVQGLIKYSKMIMIFLIMPGQQVFTGQVIELDMVEKTL